MSRLEELIQELCPDGVEYKKLGDVAEISRGGNFQKKDFREKGFPCIHYGQIYTKLGLFVYAPLTYIDNEKSENQKKAKHGDIIVAVTSENVEDVCKCVAWLGEDEIAVSGHTAIIHSMLNPKYLTYYLQSSHFYTQKLKLAHGTKVIEVTPSRLNNVVVPVPPLEVQREIVHILDSFTLLTAELTAELTARKKQYEYYRNQLLTFDKPKVIWQTLGDIGKISMCKRIMKNQTTPDGDVPFYKIGTFGKKADAFISKAIFDEYREKYSFPKRGDVLISAAGTIGRIVVYDGTPAYFQDSNIVWIDNDETQVLNAFLKYWYQIAPWKVSTGGTIARLYNDNIARTKVPVLPIAIQQRIVHTLDNFEKICTDLNIGLPAEIEARQKQYEFYRDQLLTFAESGNSILTDRQTDRQTDRA